VDLSEGFEPPQNSQFSLGILGVFFRMPYIAAEDRPQYEDLIKSLAAAILGRDKTT